MTKDDLNSMIEMLRKIGLNVMIYPPEPIHAEVKEDIRNKDVPIFHPKYDDNTIDLVKGEDYHELTSNGKS